MAKIKLGTLTVEMLVSAGACQGQLEIFKRWFPYGFTPSAQNFIRAGRANLSLSWAIEKFLPEWYAEDMYKKVQVRRWVGPFRTVDFENYNTSLGIIWWNLIKEQTGIED